jgi:rubrerythrin
MALFPLDRSASFSKVNSHQGKYTCQEDVMNVFDFAMDMEDAGRDYYENMANNAFLPGLKSIFMSLAEDERKHYLIFQKLKAGIKAESFENSTVIETARNVFKNLPRDASALKGIHDTLTAYQHAMKLEADSFRLYEDVAAKETDDSVKNLLLKIAAEEHKHFNVLENLYHFVNAPNQHLAWGEFSNLDEFRQFGRDVDD